MPDLTDFDGCRRACRKNGRTLVWGDCEHAAQPPEPEPTVYITQVRTADDGWPTVSYRPVKVADLDEVRALRAELERIRAGADDREARAWNDGWHTAAHCVADAIRDEPARMAVGALSWYDGRKHGINEAVVIARRVGGPGVDPDPASTRPRRSRRVEGKGEERADGEGPDVHAER